MANQFLTLHVKKATVTLVSTTTVNSTNVTVPAGAIVTGITVQNVGALTGAGNITVLVDTVAQTAATAATLTSNVAVPIAPLSTGLVPTIITNNGGLIGVTTSTNTVGVVNVYVSYLI
jgi:hypothetical protein